MERILNSRNFVFFNAISLQTQAELKSFLPCNDYTIFFKNTLHKSYNFTTYSNITAERTLHKIIITHITFIFTKRSFFKEFKHMMHTIDTQLLCRHLGCHNRDAPPLLATPPPVRDPWAPAIAASSAPADSTGTCTWTQPARAILKGKHSLIGLPSRPIIVSRKLIDPPGPNCYACPTCL